MAVKDTLTIQQEPKPRSLIDKPVVNPLRKPKQPKNDPTVYKPQFDGVKYYYQPPPTADESENE